MLRSKAIMNVDKATYIVVYRNKNAGRRHNIKTNNSSSARVGEIKYLGTTLKNQNSFQEEIKSRWKSGNACYHSVQNTLSSSLLSKNLKIKIYKNKFCLWFFTGVNLGRLL